MSNYNKVLECRDKYQTTAWFLRTVSVGVKCGRWLTRTSKLQEIDRTVIRSRLTVKTNITANGVNAKVKDAFLNN